jgi:uncharacterized tellurite resistance protein B-like protein
MSTQDPIVFAVQSAVLDLLDLIEFMTPHAEPSTRETFGQEAQKTILMMIAAIIVANRGNTSTNSTFLSSLIDCRDLPGGEVRYLNEYAARWNEAANQIPHFFEAAVQYDSVHKTGIARSMLQHVQLIGNNACASDGKIAGAEHGIVQDYIIRLEQFLESGKSTANSEQIAAEPIVYCAPSDFYEEPEPEYEIEAPQLVTPPNKSGLRWVPANESITIADYPISSGMIYVSSGETVEEASAINIKLPIGKSGLTNSASLNYYPQYTWLSPDQRTAYLQWLVNDRKDVEPEKRELGYVFLFFYGLERRLLIDKSQEQEVIAEVVRLLTYYGPYTRSRSLQSYTSQLIHFWGWQQGADYYATLLEWMQSLPVSLLGRDEISIVLASNLLREKCLSCEMAYELASRDLDVRRSIVVSRVNEEFRSLFSKRYAEQFPDGFALKQSRGNARLTYRPASPTLLYDRSDFSIQIPDVMGLSNQFKPLAAIWNSCVADLSGYSRVKGKAGDMSARLKAHIALPMELRVESSHPLASAWKGILEKSRAGKSCAIVRVGEVSQLLEIPEREKLTRGQSCLVANTIQSLGFQVEPDARIDSAYSWDQEFAVYPDEAAKPAQPSEQYHGASLLLKLCVFMAGADGQVSSEEVDVSRKFIQKNIALSPEEQRRLEALEHVLIGDPLRIRSSLGRIAESVPQQKRVLICELLVYVAAADNIITKDEIRALERVFKAFGLSSEQLEAQLKAIASEFREITIQTRGDQVPGEKIPAPSQPFHINMSRVDQIARETSEVIGILSRVMIDDDLEAARNPEQVGTDGERSEASTSVKPQTCSVPDWVNTLDPKYHIVLLRLIERESWPRADFDGLAKENRLMPLDVLGAINEWSDEHLGDFLIEEGDPILIHKESIPC